MTEENPAAALEPEDLWAQITALPRPHRIVDFPAVSPKTGKPYPMIMVVLSQEETIAAAATAEKITRRLLRDEKGNFPSKDDISKGYDTVFNTESSLEILWRSCKHPQDETLRTPFFKTRESIGSLTADQIGVLMHHYYHVQAELGPIMASLGSEEEMEGWISTLARAGNLYPLDSLSWGALMTLVGFLVRRVFGSPTASSSSISPPDTGVSGEPVSSPVTEPESPASPSG